MATNPLGINQGTNSYINFDQTGTVNTQVVDIRQGTVTLSGGGGTTVTVDHGTITLSNPTGTTVQFNNGTVDLLKAGTVTRLEGGTINLVTRVGNVGTVEVGTISTLPNIPGGTLGVVTTVSNVTNGSIVVTAGTVAAHAITAATITEGTLRNLISGTINAATAVLNSGTINVATAVITTLPNLPQGSINVTAGTIATLGTMGTLGLVNTVTTVSNLTNGSIVVTNGTIAAHAITAATITEGTLRNLISGTINAATAVLNSGTINVGTFVMPSGTVTSVTNLAAGTITPNLSLGRSTLGTLTGTGQSITINTVGANCVGLDLRGNLDATIQFEATINDSNWFAVVGYSPISGRTTKAVAEDYEAGGSANSFVFGVGGLSQFRMRTSGYVSGNGTVTLYSTYGQFPIQPTIARNGKLIDDGQDKGMIVSGRNVAAGTTAMLGIDNTTGGLTTALVGGTIKDNLAAVGTFTITVAALASSTAGVGRQSTLIDNSTNLYSGAIVAAQITAGSVTAANNLISLYLIRSDNGAPIADDNAGTGDAGWTQQNASLLGNILVPTVGTALQYKAVFDTAGLGHLGPKWGIGVVHSLGNNLHATAGSHSITYTGYNARF